MLLNFKQLCKQMKTILRYLLYSRFQYR